MFDSLFFSVTRVHYAFDRFDGFQCNLFRPETQIFPVDGIENGVQSAPSTQKFAKKILTTERGRNPPNLLTRTRRSMLASMLHFARSRNCTLLKGLRQGGIHSAVWADFKASGKMLEHKEGEEQQEENYSDQLEKHVVTSLYYKAAELMHCKSFVLIKNWVKKKCTTKDHQYV